MAKSITAEEQRKRDRNLGIGYSICTTALTGFLLFYGIQHNWGPKIQYVASNLPAISQSVISGKGIPLGNEESAKVLKEGYAILGDYNSRAATYTQRFYAEYLADENTRVQLRNELQKQVDSLSSSSCGLYWMKPKARPVSPAYEKTYRNLETCRHDLYKYFSMLLESMNISLKYVEPFYEEEIDEMLRPIASSNGTQGQNLYLSEFNRLYPESNPSKVQVK